MTRETDYAYTQWVQRRDNASLSDAFEAGWRAASDNIRKDQDAAVMDGQFLCERVKIRGKVQ